MLSRKRIAESQGRIPHGLHVLPVNPYNPTNRDSCHSPQYNGKSTAWQPEDEARHGDYRRPSASSFATCMDTYTKGRMGGGGGGGEKANSVCSMHTTLICLYE